MLVYSALTSLILEDFLGKASDLNENYTDLVQNILGSHEELIKKSIFFLEC